MTSKQDYSHLRSYSILSELSDEELCEFGPILKTVEVNRGDSIFREGDQSRDLYLIKSGQLEIVVRDLTLVPKPIAVLKSGDFFGENSILDASAIRSSTVKALQNCTLLVAPYEDLERLVSKDQSINRAIRAKIHRTLTARLRENTKKAVTHFQPEHSVQGKILVAASPRSGAGKTTFTTTLAGILARECNKKVLLIDLDIFFGDATFLFGGYAEQSVGKLARRFRDGPVSLDEFQRHLLHPEERIWVLPAAKSIIDAEAPTPDEIVLMAHQAQEHFDYIIIDTEAGINDSIITSIELSDHTFFLIDKADFLNIKNSVRYFHALSRFNFPENKLGVFLTRMPIDTKIDEMPRIHRYSVSGVLPEVPGAHNDCGKTFYNNHPASPYCSFLRQLVETLLKERINREPSERKLLARFFSVPEEPASAACLLTSHAENDALMPSMEITELNLGALLHDIRNRITDGHRDEAQKRIRKLLYFCPDSARLFQVLGELLVADGNVSEAVIVLKKALSIEPTNHVASGYLGYITGERSLAEKALMLVKQKIAQAPNYPDLWNDLGRIHLQLNDTASGIEAFRKSLKINADFIEARINLGIALGESRQCEDAIAELEKVDRKSVRVYYFMGCFLQDTGRFPEAYEAFSKAMDIMADYGDLRTRMDRIRSYLQRVETLIEMHRENMQDNHRFPDLHFNLANLYLLVGKKEEAMLELMEAVKLKPDYPEAKQKLASIEKQLKEAEMAA